MTNKELVRLVLETRKTPTNLTDEELDVTLSVANGRGLSVGAFCEIVPFIEAYKNVFGPASGRIL